MDQMSQTLFLPRFNRFSWKNISFAVCLRTTSRDFKWLFFKIIFPSFAGQWVCGAPHITILEMDLSNYHLPINISVCNPKR